MAKTLSSFLSLPSKIRRKLLRMIPIRTRPLTRKAGIRVRLMVMMLDAQISLFKAIVCD
jgi:hypothetical protein